MDDNPVSTFRILSYVLLLQLGIRLSGSLTAGFISEGTIRLVWKTAAEFLSLALPAAAFFRMSGIRPGKLVSFAYRFPARPFFSACTVLGSVTAAGMVSDKIAAFMTDRGIILREGFTAEREASVVYFIVYFIASVPLAAITEEFFYRGILLNTIVPYNRIFALVLQSVLFACLHDDPRQFLHAACGGFFLGVLTLESGSLVFAVIVHTFNNALAFLFLYSGFFDRIRIPLTAVVSAAGLFGLILLAGRARGKENQSYPPGRLFRLFILSPAALSYFVLKILLLPGWFGCGYR